MRSTRTFLLSLTLISSTSFDRSSTFNLNLCLSVPGPVGGAVEPEPEASGNCTVSSSAIVSCGMTVRNKQVKREGRQDKTPVDNVIGDVVASTFPIAGRQARLRSHARLEMTIVLLHAMPIW